MSGLQVFAGINPPELPDDDYYGIQEKQSPEEPGLPFQRIEAERERSYKGVLESGSSKAFAFSDPNGSLGTFASSLNQSAQLNASSSSIFVSDFSIPGNINGTPIPLTFHFNLSGKLKAQTPPGLYLAIAEAEATATFSSDSSFEYIGGGAKYTSISGKTTDEDGKSTFLRYGIFDNNNFIQESIFPKLNFVDLLSDNLIGQPLRGSQKSKVKSQKEEPPK